MNIGTYQPINVIKIWKINNDRKKILSKWIRTKLDSSGEARLNNKTLIFTVKVPENKIFIIVHNI